MAHDSSQDNPNTIIINYLKSPLYRTVHADGLFGGLTPQRNIHMSFFNERNPIPQIIEHEVTPEGTLGKEILEARIGKKGIVREVDIDVVINLSTAKSMRDWLNEKIQTLEGLLLNPKT